MLEVGMKNLESVVHDVEVSAKSFKVKVDGVTDM